MSLTNLGRRVGNNLYKFSFPIYQPLYTAFKWYTDRADRHLLAQHLSPGCVVVDAGANIGIYSQFLANCVKPGGVVHSFEPSPENFAHLRNALSHVPNVQLNQLAVSDKTGESVLYVSDDLNVDHRAYPTDDPRRKRIAIQTTRLDDYFPEGERVDLIKMDIQGFELHALRGATRVLDDNPGIKLLLEYWPYGLKQAHVSAESLITFLQARGFSLFRIGKNGLSEWKFPISDNFNSLDYFTLFAQRTPRSF